MIPHPHIQGVPVPTTDQRCPRKPCLIRCFLCFLLLFCSDRHHNRAHGNIVKDDVSSCPGWEQWLRAMALWPVRTEMTHPAHRLYLSLTQLWMWQGETHTQCLGWQKSKIKYLHSGTTTCINLCHWHWHAKTNQPPPQLSHSYRCTPVPGASTDANITAEFSFINMSEQPEPSSNRR